VCVCVSLSAWLGRPQDCERPDDHWHSPWRRHTEARSLPLLACLLAVGHRRRCDPLPGPGSRKP
jgi:hypothetical protein